VLDNLREGVLKPDWYDPTLNSLYRDVLDHHSVIALPCRPYHPNRKGKVESSVGHAHTGRPGALPPGLLFRLGCEGPPTPISSPSQLGASGRPDLSQQTPAGRAAAITLDGKANTGPGATPRHRMRRISFGRQMGRHYFRVHRSGRRT